MGFLLHIVDGNGTGADPRMQSKTKEKGRNVNVYHD